MKFINKKIGFIGTGQMATALACGLINKDVVDASKIYGYDVYEVSANRFRTNTGGSLMGTAHEVFDSCDIVFLGVKPYQMGGLLDDLSAQGRRNRTEGKIIISIAAGIKLATYMKYLGNQAPIVRVMPNTPCLIGEAASGYCLSPAITRADADLVKGLLETVGTAIEVTENLLDAVTGLSGSGPAFVFTMIEAMADGGVKMGLPRDIALRLAAQTFKGAAQMILATGEHPAVLKDRVTSPGGTTITGLAALEGAAFRAALINAVEASTLRSIELGQ